MQDDKFILISIPREELESIIRDAVKQELISAAKQKNEKGMLNAKEICEYLGIHISTFNTWKANGKIPFKRLGKRVFFDWDEVKNALKENNYYKAKKILT
jgi:excisionase family DNA binding protein